MPARKDPRKIIDKVRRMRDNSKPLLNEPCAVQHLTGLQWLTLLHGTPSLSVSEALRNAIDELASLRSGAVGGMAHVSTDEARADELKRRGWVVLAPDEAATLARDATDDTARVVEATLLARLRPAPRPRT